MMKVRPFSTKEDLLDERRRIQKIIGKRVRAARERAKLTQNELGNALNLSFEQIQKYENGHNPISAALIYQLAGVVNVE